MADALRPSGEAVTRPPGCSTCRHVVPTAHGWECHRYPPALLSTVQGTTQLRVGWPNVCATTFCGEWAGVEWKPVPEPTPDDAAQERDEWRANVLHALDLPLHRSVEDAVEAIEGVTARLNLARQDAVILRAELRATRAHLRDVLRGVAGAETLATAYLNNKEKTP